MTVSYGMAVIGWAAFVYCAYGAYQFYFKADAVEQINGQVRVALFLTLVVPALLYSGMDLPRVVRYVLFYLLPSALSVAFAVSHLFSLMKNRGSFRLPVWALCAFILAYCGYSLAYVTHIRSGKDMAVAGTLRNTVAFHAKLQDAMELDVTNYLSRVYFCSYNATWAHHRDRPYIPYSHFEVDPSCEFQAFSEAFNLSSLFLGGRGFMVELVGSKWGSCQDSIERMIRMPEVVFTSPFLVDVKEFTNDKDADVPPFIQNLSLSTSIGRSDLFQRRHAFSPDFFNPRHATPGKNFVYSKEGV